MGVPINDPVEDDGSSGGGGGGPIPWADITDAPSLSSVNATIAAAHTHSNKAILDAFEGEGQLSWGGNVISYEGHNHVWSAITNAPPLADVNDAIAKSHTHANKATLDLLESSGSDLNYNGNSLAFKVHSHAWADITDAPSLASVTSAIADSHTHANKSTLDLLGVSGGDITYSGSALAYKTHTHAWADITDAPSLASVTSAIANSHTHANKAVLDLFTAPSGVPSYNGVSLLQSAPEGSIQYAGPLGTNGYPAVGNSHFVMSSAAWPSLSREADDLTVVASPANYVSLYGRNRFHGARLHQIDSYGHYSALQEDLSTAYSLKWTPSNTSNTNLASSGLGASLQATSLTNYGSSDNIWDHTTHPHSILKNTTGQGAIEIFSDTKLCNTATGFDLTWTFAVSHVTSAQEFFVGLAAGVNALASNQSIANIFPYIGLGWAAGDAANFNIRYMDADGVAKTTFTSIPVVALRPYIVRISCPSVNDAANRRFNIQIDRVRHSGALWMRPETLYSTSMIAGGPDHVKSLSPRMRYDGKGTTTLDQYFYQMTVRTNPPHGLT